MGKLFNEKNNCMKLRCLEKPLGVKEVQQLEREDDAVYYEKIYVIPVILQLVSVGKKCLWIC